MVAFNTTSMKWVDVGGERTKFLLQSRLYNYHRQMDENHLVEMKKQNEAAIEEEGRGNFLCHVSSKITGGKLSNTNGTHSSNALLTLDAVRSIKKNHLKDVGKSPTIVDFTSGEFGFHSPYLFREGSIIKVDKYKNRSTITNNDKFKDVLAYEEIPSITQPLKIAIIDLPYAPVNGNHHAGNCDVAGSAGHIKKHQRYSVHIPLTPPMILLIHIRLFIIVRGMLPAEGGWLLVKSMRSAEFDLPLQIQKMLNENGFEEKSRVLFPSSNDDRNSTLHLELNPTISKSFMQIYRSTKKISHGGMPTMRLHQYEKTILPQAISDARALVIVMLRKCKLWMDNSDAFFAAIASMNPREAILQSSCHLFPGMLGELFEIEKNKLVWNVNIESSSLKSDDYDLLENDAYLFCGLQLKLANISFIYFSELLKVHQPSIGKDYSKYKREPALKYAKIPLSSQSFYTCDTVERLFDNVEMIRKQL